MLGKRQIHSEQTIKQVVIELILISGHQDKIYTRLDV